jgi:GNAT superfamily N-acetyltransferase
VTGQLRVIELTSSDQAALRDGFELRRTVQEHDLPGDLPHSWRSFSSRHDWPWPGSEESMRAFYDGTDLVAWCAIYLQQNDNLDVAQLEIDVHPDHRGRGIGQEVLARLTPALTAQGRTRFLFECAMGGTGERFLRAAGARCVVADTERRLLLADVDPGLHDAMLEDALRSSADYELVTWVGATPKELLEDVAVLQGRMSTDPPLDDLSWEPETYDAARVVARDRMMAAHGMRVYAAATRHRGTGTTVGITTLVVFSDVPGFGDQWETIVLPEHRGHRLGALLKVANLRQALKYEPDLAAVHTWNADSNAPMLAVNMAMGFTPLREWGEWELATQPSTAMRSGSS